MGLALEKDAEECYSVDMNDAVRHGMCVSILASELARELGCDEEFIPVSYTHLTLPTK